MKVYAIIEDRFATNFCRSCDVFEKFKFVGKMIEFESNKSAREILDSGCDENFRVAVVIIPNIAAIAYEDCKVFSTGLEFAIVDDMAKTLGGIDNVEYV